MNAFAARLPLLFLVSALVAPCARGAVTVEDLHAPGDGLITRDTASGLGWLDLSATRGFSWDAVSSLLGTGGPLAGFRRPTEVEVQTFWSDAGVPDIALVGGTATVANFEPVGRLQQIWGSAGQLPFTPPGTTATLATTAHSFNPVDGRIEGVPLLLRFDRQGTAVAVIDTLLGIPSAEAAPYLAHALVQPAPAIPEPATVVLLLVGVASVGVMRRMTAQPGR